MAPEVSIGHARHLFGMIWMINSASMVIQRVLYFVCIPSWEVVVVSPEIRAKSAEKGLQFAWVPTVAFLVRNFELKF